MIEVHKCTCGHQNCSVYQLKGIGTFYQGSGFEKEDAKKIAKFLNEEKANEKEIKG